MSDNPALEVVGLSAGYGRIQVVQDVHLQVGAGEMVAVLGRNGAGKSTSLMAIAGLRYGPGAGTVSLEGRQLSGMRPHAIVAAGLNLVPEGRRIFHEMTVADNLALGAFARRRFGQAFLGPDLERVHQLFPALSQYRTKQVGELSGGQQQMVAIAQALMSQPRVLMLDEPMAGLAPTLVEEIYDRLRGLVDEGLAVLVVDQSVERAVELSDRFYVVEDGRTVMEGRSELSQAERINDVVLGRAAVALPVPE